MLSLSHFLNSLAILAYTRKRQHLYATSSEVFPPIASNPRIYRYNYINMQCDIAILPNTKPLYIKMYCHTATATPLLPNNKQIEL